MIGCADNDQKLAQGHVESARKFLAQRKVQTAIIEYRNAVNLDPNNGGILFELAEAYVLNKEISNAVRYYNLAAKADPDSILAYLRLAQIHMQTGALLEARHDITNALKVSPDSVSAHHILSGIQVKERDIKAAIETLEKAANIDDKNIKTYISLASLYIQNNNPGKAEQAYKHAINADSESRTAYMGLVRLYIAQKKWDDAETLLKSVLETPGSKIEKNSDMAMFYQSCRQFDKAETYFQKAVDIDPGNVGSLMNLAEFYTRMNQESKAVITMKNAMAKKPDSPQVLTNLAQVFLHFNRVEEASTFIEKALTADNEYVGALFQKGRVLMAKGDFSGALDLFDQVVAQDKVNAQAYYYRAECIEARGASDRPEQKIFRAAAGMLDDPAAFEKDQVKTNLLAVVTINPRHLEARRKLLEIYLLEGNVIEARKQMNDILGLAPTDIKTMSLMSGLKLIEGDIDAARQILMAIIKDRPDYFPAYVRLGKLHENNREYDQALEYYREAFDIMPNQSKPGLIKLMTNIFIVQKQFDMALETINAMSVKAPDDSAAFFANLKGEVFMASGQAEKAFEHFVKSADMNPKYIMPRMHMAAVYLGRRDYKMGLELLKEVESINPRYVPALFAIGTIHHQKGNIEKAEIYYRKVLGETPDHVDAANNLAFILSEKKGGTDEALLYATKAREKAPKNADVMDTLGWIYYQKGNYLNALSEFEESLKIKSDSALAWFHYGMALYRNREFEKARRYLKKALELDPEFKDAETARQMLN